MGDNTTQAGPAGRWLGDLAEAIASRESERVTALFGDECYWRDLLSMTWNLHTAEGRDAIGAMLDDVGPDAWPTDLVVTSESEADGVGEAWFTFGNATFTGKGLVRVRDGEGWTILTSAQSLKDFPEPSGPRRTRGAEHGVNVSTENWLDRRTKQVDAWGTVGVTAGQRDCSIPEPVIDLALQIEDAPRHLGQRSR